MNWMDFGFYFNPNNGDKEVTFKSAAVKKQKKFSNWPIWLGAACVIGAAVYFHQEKLSIFKKKHVNVLRIFGLFSNEKTQLYFNFFWKYAK